MRISSCTTCFANQWLMFVCCAYSICPISSFWESDDGLIKGRESSSGQWSTAWLSSIYCPSSTNHKLLVKLRNKSQKKVVRFIFQRAFTLPVIKSINIKSKRQIHLCNTCMIDWQGLLLLSCKICHLDKEKKITGHYDLD